MEISKGISVAMIVKNEAKFIRRSIESVMPWCNEVVVYLDSHSNDGTREILAGLGEKIKITENWYDEKLVPFDFSKARNETLKLCRYSWIFILDGDERFDGDGEKLAKFLNGDIVKGTVFKLVVKQNLGDISAAEFTQPRIFPARRGVLYHGNVHNQPTWPKDLRVAELNVSIIHDGASDPEKHVQRKARTEMLLTDLLKRLDSGEGSIVDYYNAVKMLMVVERPEDSYRYGMEGMKLFNSLPVESKRQLNRFQIALVRCAVRMGNWSEVGKQLEAHKALVGDSVDGSFFSFAYNYRQGNFIGAYCDGLKYLELMAVAKEASDRFESTLMFGGMVSVTLEKLRYFIKMRGSI